MNLLLIGGTGAIGMAIIDLALKIDWSVHVLALDRPSEGLLRREAICFEYFNIFNKKHFVAASAKFKAKNIKFDAIIDIASYSEKTSKWVCDYFSEFAARVIIVSSSLVGWWQDYKIGIETYYMRRKRLMEEFWFNQFKVDWTIVRPHHVTGKYTYLGCCPPYNRIKDGVRFFRCSTVLYLYDEGEMQMSYIDAKDLAGQILGLVEHGAGVNKIYYSACNVPVYCYSYFIELMKLLGETEIKVSNFVGPIQSFWQFSTYNQVYNGMELQYDSQYKTTCSLGESLMSAIKYEPLVEFGLHARVCQFI